MRRLTKNDVQVFRLLKKGADNKVAKRQLMAETGMSARNLYDTIEVLRSLGIPIMASRTSRIPATTLPRPKMKRLTGLPSIRNKLLRNGTT